MHEYPITIEIINIAKQYALDNNLSKVHKIALVIGDYSGYVGDSIMMYFEEISKGTICEGAQVTIEHIKPQLLCTQCGKHFVRRPLSFDCTYCGGPGAPSEIGKEFYIDYIEAE